MRIDKEGIWYFRGEEMTRLDIVQYFYKHLRSDDKGSFYIEIDAERCSVDVEDVPYVITSVSLIPTQCDDESCLVLSLSDGSREILDCKKSLRMGRDNVLYSTVREGKFEARFSRPAYYQLCRYIEYDPVKGTYVIKLDHRSISINTSLVSGITGN